MIINVCFQTHNIYILFVFSYTELVMVYPPHHRRIERRKINMISWRWMSGKINMINFSCPERNRYRIYLFLIKYEGQRLRPPIRILNLNFYNRDKYLLKISHLYFESVSFYIESIIFVARLKIDSWNIEFIVGVNIFFTEN